ncbi:right-handed parallel beta-helix repeat-containing protein [Methanosarcina soligelidi]|uniref:right-handed parallel beta-helix repeat-containing protein n=1 Tax=Methanosarcina soligelidi TaxID=1036677 RepID=UPI0009FD5E77|nr:right-handed parallel beta-helix repeat-containing protein [Methanosarcina soligelidi]
MNKRAFIVTLFLIYLSIPLVSGVTEGKLLNIFFDENKEIIANDPLSDDYNATLSINRMLSDEDKRIIASDGLLASNNRYYVSPQGNDTNDGKSIEHAFRTIKYAASVAQAGDTVEVLNGKYSEQNIVVNHQGIENYPIVFHKYNGSITLDGRNGGMYSFYLKENQWITIDGFDIIGYSTGINVYNSENIKIVNFTCTEEDYGIKVSGSKYIEIRNGSCRNINATGIDITSSENFKIMESTLDNQNYGFVARLSKNINVSNISCDKLWTGIDLISSDNVLVKNFTITNTSCDGIKIETGCDYIDINNGTIHDTYEHGIVIRANNSHVNMSHIDIKDNGHNQIDIITDFEEGLIENCNFSYTPGKKCGLTGLDTVSVYIHNYNVNDVTVKNSTFSNTPRPFEIYNAHNITISNNYLSGYSKRVLLLGGIKVNNDTLQRGPRGCFDILIKDNIFKDSEFIVVYYTHGKESDYPEGKHAYFQNITFINNSYTNITNEYMSADIYTNLKDIYAIDEKINTSSNKSMLYGAFDNVENSRLINTNILDIYSTKKSFPEYSNSYYLDMVVKDRYGNLIPESCIELVSCNDKLISTNGWGDKKIEFYTGLNGRTSFPSENREESPTLSEYFKNTLEFYENTSYTAEITSPSYKNLNINITPDRSWYRPDPNIPTYTITAIIPDNSTGPHITGFAPAKENPFNPGEKKNFRIWTDEPLTSMEWRVNGSSVLKGSLNYTWTVTDRNTTIEFIGSNSNGTVNHIWPLGESPDEPSVPDDNPAQEIQFSPSDSEITLNVSEKTLFSVSPDIFTTKEWYINGYPIQNNTTSMIRCWSTAGTRDVTFKGAGSEEPVSHTWTVNVVEEKKNDEESTESIIAITPEYQIVTPKQSFGLDITVDPSTPITGTQLDFTFNSSMASANSVIEGDIFKQKGASTFFNEGDINSSEGIIKHIYGLIIGTSNVSSPGTFATVNLTAGNRTGMAEFSLSNVLISDINSKSVPYTVTNATVLIDTAPAIDPICCPKSVDEKSNLAFKISAKDADGDRLTLSASGLPEGSSFNRTSGAFAWTPAVGQAGVYTITFKVSDGYLTDFENVTVTVNKLNNPPVINFFEPINGSSFSEGERIGISVNATDAEKQALNYSIKIDGVMYSSDLAYVWETDYSSSGNHTIEVSVSDGIDEAKMQHSIYISECHPRYDVNEDGVVNILDITNVSREYETTVSKPYPRYDTNQDGEINILDLTLVGHHFGEKVE